MDTRIKVIMVMNMVVGITLMMLLNTISSYAITPEDKSKAILGALTAQELVSLMKKGSSIIDGCTLQIELGIITDNCIGFITEYRDSIKEVVNKYEGNMSLTASDIGSMLSDLPSSNNKFYEP